MVRTRRRSVLLLLLALTVLSPLALYTSRLPAALSSIQTRDFPGEITNQGRGVKADKLNVLPLETVSSLKEPVGVVFSEELGGLVKESSESDGQELSLRKAGEHKSRMLSEVTAAADGTEVIEQVTRRQEAQDGDSASAFSEEKEKTTGSQQKLSSEESLHETMPKQTSPKLIKAKVYLGLGTIRANSQYLKDLRQRIREVQKALGDASKDSDLPKNANEKVKALEQMLIRGKQMQDDCSIVIKKLRAMLHSAEEQLHAHKKQTVFLTQLAAKTLPKGLHCLPLRLANDYFSLDPDRQQFANQHKLSNPKLYHYALFSDNILATAVVVNSTVLNAKLDKMVFLDDDIVVKKDLTGLWSINMKGKNQDRSLWKLGTLPAGLITFWNKTFPLSRSWHVLGLGYNPHVNSRDIERATVIHYNGNMKPWLEIGLPKFRSYWSKYLNYDQPFLRECNINP
nr:unnamed protein product [Digitaria exilis]